MNTQLLRKTFIVVVPFFILALAACTPRYLYETDFGTAATAEQITAHYAGNSVKYSLEPGGKPNVEAYFAADGSFKSVVLDKPAFSVGTWEAYSRFKPAKVLIQTKVYELQDGQFLGDTITDSFIVFILPDGTVATDPLGGGKVAHPKPTRGFQARNRWKSLMRKAGLYD